MQGVLKCLASRRVLFLLSALCLALPFTFPALFVLSFVGAALLFAAAEQKPKKTELRSFFASGFGFAFVYHLGVYHWLLALHPLSVAGIYGLPSFLIVLLAYLGASAIHALFFGLAFLLWGALCRLTEKRALRALLFGICLLFAEALTSVGALAFPWARFSLPLAAAAPLLSAASLFGPVFCEALLLAVGALLSRAAEKCEGKLTFRVLPLVLAGAILLSQVVLYFLLPFVWGEGRRVTVAAVQTAYGFDEKWETSPSDIAEFLHKQTLLAAEAGAELVVFPESALSTTMMDGDASEEFFASLSRESGVAIAAGSLYYVDGEYYNAVCLFDENGLLSYNAKRHLVPFGEYLPWRSVFEAVLPAVSDMAYYRSTLSVGDEALCGEVCGITCGGLVCFDTLFSPLACASAKAGAELLVAPTNDAWFKDSPAAKQHLMHGAWRAAECGTPLVQSANNGISAVVDARGRVLSSVPLGEGGFALAEVELCASPSLYAETGELVLPACVLFVSGFVSASFVRKLQRKGAR